MIVIGKRAYGTDRFRWFYHPLLPQKEKEFFHFFVWFGKNWYICWHKDCSQATVAKRK